MQRLTGWLFGRNGGAAGARNPLAHRTEGPCFGSGISPASRRAVFEPLEAQEPAIGRRRLYQRGDPGRILCQRNRPAGRAGVGPLRQPGFHAQDVRIDFNWGTTAQPGGSPDPAFASVSHNNFSVLWTGDVIPKFSQTYTFTATTAGERYALHQAAGRLHLDDAGQQLDRSRPSRRDTATYALIAGQTYDVELQYCQPTTGATAECKLHWSSLSTPDEAIEPATPSASISRMSATPPLPTWSTAAAATTGVFR